jgi:hypothetical protein
MATKKPIKKGAIPEPPNPRAEPGCFIVRGKAWFNEYGQMVIEEDGSIPDDIDWDLVEEWETIYQCGDFLYDENAYRNDGKLRSGATPRYELRWCPVQKYKRRKLNGHLARNNDAAS